MLTWVPNISGEQIIRSVKPQLTDTTKQ